MRPEQNPIVHRAVGQLRDDAASYFDGILRANRKPAITPKQRAEIDQLAPARFLELFKAWVRSDVEHTERLQEEARAAYVEIACKVLGLTPITATTGAAS